MSDVVKAPAGWERVLREASRYQARLRDAVLLWADTVKGFMSVDDIVAALQSGRAEYVVGEAVEAAGMAAGMGVLTEMAQAASRLAVGIVWDRLGPTLPGNLGPAGGAYPTRGTAGPFTIDFARVDHAAANWAAAQWREGWVGVSDETQRAIRAIIARAPVEGISIDQQARLLRQIIGLNSRQATAVVNRYDALIRQWQAGRLTLAQVESRVSRYEAQLLAQRATMIARTETLNAARASQLAAWQEAQAAGLISQDAMWEWGAAPDACDICAELDGTTYMMGQPGPETHPNCLPGSSLVTPCGRVTAMIERFFKGDLAVVLTAGGKRLRVTPNHPVLTRRGWIAAGLLAEGDDVVCGRGFEGTAGDHVYGDDMPAPIEQVAEAFRGACDVPPVPVPVSAVDFHGDGEGSEVAVVWADRLLRDSDEAPFGKHLPKRSFGGSDEGCPPLLVTAGAGLQVGRRLADSPGGIMGGDDLGGTLHVSHPAPSDGGGFAAAPRSDASFEQIPADDYPIDAEFDRQRLLGYAGEVSFDKVVAVKRVPFHGPVFNLETTAGFYQAEGMIVHNCRCWETRYFPGDAVYEAHRSTYTGKAVIAKPLGRFPDFAACVASMSRRLGSAEAARRYCGALEQRING